MPLGPAIREGEYPLAEFRVTARFRADGEIFITGPCERTSSSRVGRNLYPHEVEELAARAEGIRKGLRGGIRTKRIRAAGRKKLVIVAESREEDASRKAAIISGDQ